MRRILRFAQNDKLAESNELLEKSQPLAVSGIIYFGEAKLLKTKLRAPLSLRPAPVVRHFISQKTQDFSAILD
jgi:hypothetical protein